jgi:hypothetical protein
MRAAGKRLVASIVDDMRAHRLQPDAKELALLQVAGDLADQLEGLKRSINRDGYTTELKSGRLVVHPAVSQMRQVSATMAQVLQGVSMSAEPAVDRRRQRAANMRWKAVHAARAAAE